MFVATLIAAPQSAGLSLDAAHSIAELLGRRPEHLDWLHEGFAADIPFELPLDKIARTDITAIAREGGFDCVLQERRSRRKAVLLADMDSTMIGQECVDELADEIGMKERVAAITERAMNGEIAFEPALRERVALLEGLPVSIVDKIMCERIRIRPGARELVATMRASGAWTCLVSGGFTIFTRAIAAGIGFDEQRANTLIEDGGTFTGKVAEPILGAAAKAATLRELAATRKVGVHETLAVGDGANDLGMIEIAGTGVAYHAKPVVAAAAPHRIDHGDLTALLYIQGYRYDEFVRPEA